MSNATILAALLFTTLAAAEERPAQTPTSSQQLAIKGPRIDVVFAIDTTGSMGDEIDVVKDRLRQMVADIGAGQPKPDVRFGMVAFKDRGDEYLIRPVHLTRDVNSFYGHIRSLSADGGGDEPEDVAAALGYAVDKMNWDKSREVAKLVFLIGDAGPQQYEGQPTLKTLASRAKEKRIKVTTIGCSGLVGSAEAEFRRVALNTGGKFDFLTYRQIIADGRGKKTTVLTRGGETYAADGELSDKDWKKGADAMAKSGAAAPVNAKPGSGLGGLGGMGARAAAAPPPVTWGENNLDALITSEIKASAEAAGTKY